MILPKPSKELVGVPKRKLVGGLVQARVPVGLSVQAKEPEGLSVQTKECSFIS